MSLQSWVSKHGPTCFLFVAVFVLGLAGIVYGCAKGSQVFIAMGGALVGAIISTAFTSYDGSRLMARVDETVRNAITPGLTSDVGTLEALRGEFHLYHTTVTGRATHWVHSTVDFGAGLCAGRAVYRLCVQKKHYRFEAGCVDSRFICLVRAEDAGSSEQCAVWVFPSFGRLHIRDPQAGFLWHETFDSDFPEGMSRTLVSKHSICDWTANSRVDDSVGRELDRAWEELFSGKFFIFPSSGTTPQHSLK